MESIDGIVLPGGESTAMGLIGGNSSELWDKLRNFSKPVWGTCAGMILLAEKCVNASAVIENGQSLIGNLNILVCRNYFGSQISSFEMPVPPPPNDSTDSSFPGVFIRAPAILSASSDVHILGRVVATPCRQAAATLAELDRKLSAGESIVAQQPQQIVTVSSNASGETPASVQQSDSVNDEETLTLPGAAKGTNARNVICAARKGNLLCTAFHPELTDDYRWHRYFVDMVKESQRP